MWPKRNKIPGKVNAAGFIFGFRFSVWLYALLPLSPEWSFPESKKCLIIF